MKNKTLFLVGAGLIGLVLGMTGCGTGSTTVTTSTTTSASTATAVESALPLVRTGAAVATGAVLDFAVKSSGTRTRLANEMYAAANGVYSLSGGTFPSPAQLQATLVAFGGSQVDASYAPFVAAIAALYASYYPKLATGDTKSAVDLLNAIAGGIEDATQAYVTVPVAATVASS